MFSPNAFKLFLLITVIVMRVLLSGVQSTVPSEPVPADWIRRTETQSWVISDEGMFAVQGGTLKRIREKGDGPRRAGIMAGHEAWIDNSVWYVAEQAHRLPPVHRPHTIQRSTYKAYGTSPVSLVHETIQGAGNSGQTYFRVTPDSTPIGAIEREVGTLLLGLKSC